MVAGCQMPTQLLSLSPASRGLAEKVRWKSWVDIKTEKWLSNYCRGQIRLDSGETNLIFLCAPGVLGSGGLWQVQWWLVSGGSVVEPAASSTGQPLTPSERSPPAAPEPRLASTPSTRSHFHPVLVCSTARPAWPLASKQMSPTFLSCCQGR